MFAPLAIQHQEEGPILLVLCQDRVRRVAVTLALGDQSKMLRQLSVTVLIEVNLDETVILA